MGPVVGLLVLVVDSLYLWYVYRVQEGTSDQPWTVPFVASYLVVLALCAAMSGVRMAGAWRVAFLAASAAGLLLLGFFALFSIGLPLFAMGLVMLAVLIRALGQQNRRAYGAAAAGGGSVLAILVLLAGFAITERIIACPPGAVSGGGSGFLTGSYSYTCQNGRAVVTFGR